MQRSRALLPSSQPPHRRESRCPTTSTRAKTSSTSGTTSSYRSRSSRPPPTPAAGENPRAVLAGHAGRDLAARAVPDPARDDAVVVVAALQRGDRRVHDGVAL